MSSAKIVCVALGLLCLARVHNCAALPDPEVDEFGRDREALACHQQCALLVQSKVVEKFPQIATRGPEMNVSSPDFLLRSSNLRILCGIYNSTKACFMQCGLDLFRLPGVGVQNLADKFRQVDYFCSESTLIDHVDCILDAANELLNTCVQGTCMPFIMQLSQPLPPGRMVPKEVIQQKEATACNLVKCVTDCARPTIISRCGQAAQTSIDEFLAKTAALGSITAPNECKVFGQSNAN